ELLAEFLSLPAQVTSVQAKLNTLDALSSPLLNVTKALNKFSQGSSQPEGEHIKEDKGKKALSLKESKKESTDWDFNNETHMTSSMKLEEDAKAKVAKQEGEVRKAELVDLLGPEVVKKYYNDKLQYDKYRDKMLNRRAVSRITNCDVLTRKGPITLKVYREDGTSEIIPKFKASDMHLNEWREVMKACPNKTRKGWETIYKQIGLKEAEYAGLNQAKYDRLIPSEICIQAEYDICQAKYDRLIPSEI
ncbi:hypothetical protein Tco_1240223, partial [Tanacetum coccineum]